MYCSFIHTTLKNSSIAFLSKVKKHVLQNGAQIELLIDSSLQYVKSLLVTYVLKIGKGGSNHYNIRTFLPLCGIHYYSTHKKWHFEGIFVTV